MALRARVVDLTAASHHFVAAPESSDQLLEGTLEQLLYVNDESGYAVAVVECALQSGVRERVTVVGSLAGLEIGSGIRARGRREKHPRYGEQFRIVDYETIRPAGVAALERYLASEIKGVGPALARRIVEHFGEVLPQILDERPERVREVRGLGRVVADRIVAAWRDSSGLRELTVFLRGHGVGSGYARKIHKEFGRDALDTIRRDPYLLARRISGIGFRTADAIADRLGIPRNSIERARAAVVYLLERMADDGHVYAPSDYLEGQFTTALEMDGDLAARAIEELAAQGDLVVERADDATAVYLAGLHA
ncbi:MAG: helix-hairpin-helix domain-containing protein, partial [Candidatus Binataceae bacterium]